MPVPSADRGIHAGHDDNYIARQVFWKVERIFVWSVVILLGLQLVLLLVCAKPQSISKNTREDYVWLT